MTITRQQLAAMDPEELQKVIETANDILKDRKEARKKELWGNVVAAIEKYEAEIEDIEVVCRCCGDSGNFDSDCEDEPGCLFIS